MQGQGFTDKMMVLDQAPCHESARMCQNRGAALGRTGPYTPTRKQVHNQQHTVEPPADLLETCRNLQRALLIEPRVSWPIGMNLPSRNFRISDFIQTNHSRSQTSSSRHVISQSHHRPFAYYSHPARVLINRVDGSLI